MQRLLNVHHHWQAIEKDGVGIEACQADLQAWPALSPAYQNERREE